MIRVLWEEWRGANRFSSVRIVPPALFGALFSLLVTQFQPGALFLVLGLAAVVGGVLSGTQRWNQVSARDWIGLEGAGALEYGVGKVSGFVLVLAAWAVCFLPPLVLVSLVWAMPWETAAQALVWMTVAALGAQALSQAVTWGTGEFLRLIGGLLAFLWMAVTMQFPEANPYNPLWQMWRLFHNPGEPFDTGALAVLLGAILGLWVLVVLLLSREGRR